MVEQTHLKRHQSERIKNRILLIENDPEFKLSLSRLLNKENFQLTQADTFDDALTLLDKNLFGIVLFGLNQPFYSSIEQLKLVAAHKQKPHIILLSAFNYCEVTAEIADLHLKDVLIKPVKKESIIESILNIKKTHR